MLCCVGINLVLLSPIYTHFRKKAGKKNRQPCEQIRLNPSHRYTELLYFQKVWLADFAVDVLVLTNQ